MMNLRKSSKKQAKIKLALQGCAGSGKTYSALLLAYGLCNDWTKIAVIDSENGSADLYAHLGSYNVLSLSDSFTPETYMEAIKVCEDAGMKKIDVLNAKADTARHVADVFLQVAYGDSTKEQIVVPMVEVKGEWKMR